MRVIIGLTKPKGRGLLEKLDTDGRVL